MRRLVASLLLVGLTLLASPRAHAMGDARKGDFSIDAVGSVRLLGSYLHYPDVPEFFPAGDDGIAGAITRLLIDGDLGPYVDYDTNFYLDLSRLPTLAMTGGAFATAGTVSTPYRTKYLAWSFWESGSVLGEMGIDRFSIDLEVDRFSMTLGRFPINHSATFVFTPNDFFAPFSTTAVNKIYKPGVDALRLAVNIGMMSSVELDAVMGYGADGEPSWGRTGMLLRVATVQLNFEWALLGGKVAERWIVGGSFQGELGPIGVRGEGHAGFPDDDGDGHLDGDREIHGRFALGMNVLIPWHNLSISAEYAFQSDGVTRTHDYIARYMRFYPDDLPYVGRHYVGLAFSGEIIPILMFSTMGLFNVQDGSGIASIMLDLSISDEAQFVGGLMIPWGEDPVADSGPPYHEPQIKSEYGLAPLTVFFETRFYF